jgi:hypothetical protein
MWLTDPFSPFCTYGQTDHFADSSKMIRHRKFALSWRTTRAAFACYWHRTIPQAGLPYRCTGIAAIASFVGLTQNRPSGVALPCRTGVLPAAARLAGTILRKS